MINAKDEFLDEIKGKDLLCCEVATFGKPTRFLCLKIGYSEQDFNQFIKLLDFDYDEIFGNFFLRGTIWYCNNTWSERRFLNGREWWNYVNGLPIPDYLKLKLDI